MNNDERIKMITKEIAYDLLNLSGEDSTHELPLSIDSAEVRQHGLMASQERLALVSHLEDVISLYSILLEENNDALPNPEETGRLLKYAITIFVSHMLKTGALRLGNV